MAAVSLARASLEVVPASFSYELVCHVAACVWVSMFAIWNLVFVQLFVYLFSVAIVYRQNSPPLYQRHSLRDRHGDMRHHSGAANNHATCAHHGTHTTARVEGATLTARAGWQMAGRPTTRPPPAGAARAAFANSPSHAHRRQSAPLMPRLMYEPRSCCWAAAPEGTAG